MLLQNVGTFVYRVRPVMAWTLTVSGRSEIRWGESAPFVLVIFALFVLSGCPRPESGSQPETDAPTMTDSSDASPEGSESGATVPSDGGVSEATPDPSPPTPPETPGGERSSPVPPVLLSAWGHADGKVLRGKAWRLHRQGHKALRASDFTEAERLWTEAIEADHSFEAAYGALAVVHMRAKNHEACVDVSQSCVTNVFAHERLGACYYNLGKCLEHLGDDESAFDAYRNSLQSRKNATVEKAYFSVGNRLGYKISNGFGRAEAVSLTKAAATVFLRRSCKATITSERPGVFTCGPMTVWGEAGSYTATGAQEVVLVVRDERIPPADRSGYGLLWGRDDVRWRQLAKTRLLAPGEGGVDLHRAFPIGDGRGISLVQVTDCIDGCCGGSFGTLELRPSGKAVRVLGNALFSVGSGRSNPEELTKKALVTGTRQIDEDGDGAADVLLVRFETRLGSYNPNIYYLRYRMEGSGLQLQGTPPPRDALPRCKRAE